MSAIMPPGRWELTGAVEVTCRHGVEIMEVVAGQSVGGLQLCADPAPCVVTVRYLSTVPR